MLSLLLLIPFAGALLLAFWPGRPAEGRMRTVTLVVLGLLGRFAWGPIMAGLDRRETAITSRIEDAHHAAEEAAAQL